MKISEAQLRRLVRESIMSEKIGSFKPVGGGGGPGSSSSSGESGSSDSGESSSSTSGGAPPPPLQPEELGYEEVSDIDLPDGTYKQGGWGIEVTIRKPESSAPNGSRYTGYYIQVKDTGKLSSFHGAAQNYAGDTGAERRTMNMLEKGDKDEYSGSIRIRNKKVASGTKVTGHGKEFTLEVVKILHKSQ